MSGITSPEISIGGEKNRLIWKRRFRKTTKNGITVDSYPPLPSLSLPPAPIPSLAGHGA